MGDEGVGMVMKLRWPWKKKTLTYCDCPVGTCLGNEVARCAAARRSLQYYRLNDGLWHHIEMRDGSLYYEGRKMLVALDQGQFVGQRHTPEAMKRALEAASRRNN